MSDVVLRYQNVVPIEKLGPDECTIRPCYDGKGPRWWQLWFYVKRDTDGEFQVFTVPIIPGGEYNENGPGGKSWGFMDNGDGTRRVTPSINILGSKDESGAHVTAPGVHPTEKSIWHHNVTVVGVPPGEPWR